MRSYLKDNDISIKNGTDVNAVMRDMMSVILEDVLSEAFAFPYAVNGVVHSGMGSYAYCPRCFFLLLKSFRGWILPGRVIVPVWLFLCVFWRLCAP